VANEAEEAAFEHGLAAGVEEQLIEHSDTVVSRTTHGAETFDEHERRGQVLTDRTVDCRSELIARHAGGCEIKHGACRRRAAEASNGQHVDRSDDRGGVDGSTGDPHDTATSRHGELHGVGLAAIETVQGCCRLVAHPCSIAQRK
jgi:hypothetical protein